LFGLVPSFTSPFQDGAREPAKVRVLFVAWFLREERRWLGEFLPPERFECSYVGLEEPVDSTRKRTPASKWWQLPQAEEARAGSEAAARKERMKERTPRVDWAEWLKRTFDFDVFACVRCGGRRSVLAYVKAGKGVRAILEHLGLPTAGVSLAPAQELTQAAWC
jgi:hypothetical protein